jgi:hypothetical protein
MNSLIQIDYENRIITITEENNIKLNFEILKDFEKKNKNIKVSSKEKYNQISFKFGSSRKEIQTIHDKLMLIINPEFQILDDNITEYDQQHQKQSLSHNEKHHYKKSFYNNNHPYKNDKIFFSYFVSQGTYIGFTRSILNNKIDKNVIELSKILSKYSHLGYVEKIEDEFVISINFTDFKEKKNCVFELRKYFN